MDSWKLKWLFMRIVFAKKKLKLLFQFCTIHFLKSHHCFHIKKPSYLIFEVFYKSTKTWLKSLAYCAQLTIFAVSFLSNSQVLGTLWVLLAFCWASPNKMLITGKHYTVLGICFPINNKVPIIGKRNQDKRGESNNFNIGIRSILFYLTLINFNSYPWLISMVFYLTMNNFNSLIFLTLINIHTSG